MSETGTSVGEITGQSKPINSCDFRPSRPFRIVTGSEDNTVGVFEGPPFKFKMTKQVNFIFTLLDIFYCNKADLPNFVYYRNIQDLFRQYVSHPMVISSHQQVLMVKYSCMKELMLILYLKLVVQRTKEEFME